VPFTEVDQQQGVIFRRELRRDGMTNIFDTGEGGVKAVGEELCPALGLTIPVGKDSMSMKTRWQEGSVPRSINSRALSSVESCGVTV
jgi:phosphoribosylformylglycinamidine (FGAM) synthase-like enzyme